MKQDNFWSVFNFLQLRYLKLVLSSKPIEVSILTFASFFFFACQNNGPKDQLEYSFEQIESIKKEIKNRNKKEPKSALKYIDSLLLHPSSQVNFGYQFYLEALKLNTLYEHSNKELLEEYLKITESREFQEINPIFKYDIIAFTTELLIKAKNYNSGLDQLMKGISYIEIDEEKYHDKLATSYFRIGYITEVYTNNTYLSQSSFKKASDLYFKYKKYKKARKTLYNQAIVYKDGKDFKKAKELALSSLNVHKKYLMDDDSFWIWKTTYSLLVTLHVELNEMDAAKAIIQEARKQLDDSQFDNFLIHKLSYYIAAKEYTTARREIDRISKKLDTSCTQRFNWCDLLESELQLPEIKKNPTLKRKLLLKRLNYASNCGSPNTYFNAVKLKTLDSLLVLDNATNNYKDVVNWQKIKIEHNRYLKEENQAYINQLDFWIGKELKRAAESIEQQKAKITRFKLQIFILVFIAIILITLLWIIWKQYIQTKALKIKENFLANMSHELRTPLNAILGYSHLLRNTSLNITQRDYTNTITSSADVLLNQINNILYMTDLDLKKTKTHNTQLNIKNLIDSILSLYEQDITGKDIKVVLKIDPNIPRNIVSDKDKLKKIIECLINNAIKFTLQGKIVINVEMVLTINKKQILIIRVSDTGIGIDPKRIPSIFNNFSQVDISNKRTYQGIGSGLTIVQKLVKILHGNIKVTSQLEVGSEFVVKIPIEPVNESAVNQLSTNEKMVNIPKIVNNGKILLVEDSLTNQELIKAYLETWKYEVVIANNGKEAIDILEMGGNYIAVLMDIQMPIMDGFEATKRIRKGKLVLPDIPIIAITAGFGMKHFENEKKGLFTDYLLKPYKAEQLYNLLCQYITNNEINTLVS